MTTQEQIVVVEDDASMLQAIQRLLRAAGFRAQTFPSAEALLQTDAAVGAACFVFDIHLPGLSGLELQRRLVEGGIKRPVIFITAHDDPSLRDAAEHYGPAAWLQKPFAGRILLDAVSRATQPVHPGQ